MSEPADSNAEEARRWLSEAGEDLLTADLKALNPWSIRGRYPANLPDATPLQARTSLDAASRVVEAVRGALPGEEDGEGHGEEK